MSDPPGSACHEPAYTRRQAGRQPRTDVISHQPTVPGALVVTRRAARSGAGFAPRTWEQTPGRQGPEQDAGASFMRHSKRVPRSPPTLSNADAANMPRPRRLLLHCHADGQMWAVAANQRNTNDPFHSRARRQIGRRDSFFMSSERCILGCLPRLSIR